ncbi:MAG TPA: YafY family protein, partial [Cellvibrionaceae bacterium]
AVDGRTVRRYIQALESLGIPIATEPGRYGGYRLVAGFKLPPLMFTRQEMLALCLGLVAARRLGLDDAAPAIESVEAKLQRVIPHTLQRQVKALSRSARIDLPGSSSSINEHKLLPLTQAVEAQQRVRFCYCASDHSETIRELDPYGLVFSDGNWYVSGWCHLRKALRSFRLDRLDQVELLPAYFGKPEDFDAVAHLQQSIATIARAQAVNVELKASRKQAEMALGKKIGLLVEEGDKLYLRTQTDSLDWLASRLCGLYFDFIIHEPNALRLAVKNRAKQLLKLTDA